MSQDQPDYAIPSLGPISKDSRLEWQSTLWNDNNIINGQIPPAYLIGVTYKGKFFPRGCRGKIEELRIYCRRTDAGTLTLAISPHPCMGETYTVIITPGANWAWVGTALRVMWNYDSMFIWVKACSANVRYAYDTLVPRDGHTSGDVGATWQREDRRYYIRVVFDAETAGDVPISGTINNISIPSVGSAIIATTTNLPDTNETTLVIVNGAGTVMFLMFEILAAVRSDDDLLRVYCDGVLSFEDYPSRMNQKGYNDDVPGISLLQWADNGYCIVHLTLPFGFRRQLRLTAQRVAGSAAHNVVVEGSVNLIR